MTQIAKFWDEAIVPALIDYIRIPAKSPHFDRDWAKHGHIDAAVKLAADWCRKHAVPGMQLEVVRLEGRTPVLFIEVPGTAEGNILVYGHLDKQPEMTGWRATDPGDMKAARDPVGRGNDAAILQAARGADLLVCAWGNHGQHLGRSQLVLDRLRKAGVKPHLLRMNGCGEPAHPLYLPGALPPEPWDYRENRGQSPKDNTKKNRALTPA